MKFFLRPLLATAFLLLLAQLAAPARAQTETFPNQPPNQTLPDLPLRTFLPLVTQQGPNPFSGVPVLSPPSDRPSDQHGDLNLALRGYISATAELALLDIDGPTDPNAPQLRALFGDARVPTLTSAHQMYDWDWSCGVDGCRGIELEEPPVTLLGLAATPGEPLYPPRRGPQIFDGDYVALVLYAESTRLTLAYTREDTAAVGYLIHLEQIRVNPSLLQLYNQLDAAGRTQLPALRNGEVLGSATVGEVRIAIRDSGMFMDPRSRKDWWMDF